MKQDSTDTTKPYDAYEHACYLISDPHTNTYAMSASDVARILRKVEYYSKEGIDIDIQKELDAENAFRMYYDID